MKQRFLHRLAFSTFAASTLALAAHSAQAQDAMAGKAAAQACAACHGINGVSIAPVIPNLAAQKAGYIEAQLKALKSDRRKHPIMGPIAKALDDKAIVNLAAYFSGLPGAAPGGASKPDPGINASKLPFPADYKKTFTPYMTKNFPKRGQVRVYFANKPALEAAKAGKPLPDGSYIITEVYKTKPGADGKPAKGKDGFFEKGALILHTAMARDKGWGDSIPELFRNGDWHYALFTPDGKQRTKGFNHAACMGCHLPLAGKSYVFTLDEIARAAAK